MEFVEVRVISPFIRYFCDRMGNVYSKRGNEYREMKQSVGQRGYLKVTFSERGLRKTSNVHRIIMETWVGRDQEKPEVNHKNGIKTDNRLENLEWTTRLENERHSHAVLGKNMRGERHKLAKFNAEKIQDIRRMRREGHPLTRIAKHFGVGTSSIHRIVTNKSWTHVG